MHSGTLARSATTETVQLVDRHRARFFAEQVFDPSRLRPLVLLSISRYHGDRPLLDPAAVHDRVGVLADVAVLADEASSWTLRQALRRLSAWGGAVRILNPDARPDDPWQRHPLVQVDPARTAAALEQITRCLTGDTLVYSTSTPGPHAPEPAVEPDDLVAEVARLQRALSERDRTIDGLRRRNQTLVKQLRAEQHHRTGNSVLHPPTTPVYRDPEQQFRYEVEQAWLRTVPEEDRPRRPLASYALGRDWLASLDAIELVDRSRILEVVVDVLTGRAATNASRHVRRMRTHASGGAPYMVREDQAVAMRCNIKNHTAAAPRLMWWRKLDGAVELGRVALHDDTMLR
ncbi:hypothetical protein ACFW9F_06015 [Streptomyces sp. NPDC059506]|uniref:hypothetical protein n=1 Tax=Streptomyces sp. NPDC059506 TaxID=3347751 RepID=UPI0036A38E16